MRQLIIADGWFGENLPDGQFAVSKLGTVVTHLGEWPIPDEWLRFTRCFDSAGVFKAAGQSQAGAGDLVLENGVRRVLGPSYGVSTVAFDLTGEPVQNTVEYGSQGIRWIDEAGIHTGDATYVHPTIPALWEYTTHGDITVGQGESGAHLICPEGRFVLYPGYTVFIRFNRLGDHLAVSIVVPGHNVMLWFDRSEIAQFPRFEPAPPKPEPPPPPPEKPMPQAPNEFATVQRVFAAHPEIDRTNEATRGRAVDYVIAALGGKPWGRKSRNREGTDLNTDGLVYLRTDGKHEIYDIIDGNSGNATWDSDGRVFSPGENGYWAPGVPVDGGPVTPPPSGSSFAAAAAALEARIANLTSTVQEQGKLIAALAAKTGEHTSSLTGKRIALRTDNGHYVCAEGGGSGEVNATRPSAGGWETFTLEEQ